MDDDRLTEDRLGRLVREHCCFPRRANRSPRLIGLMFVMRPIGSAVEHGESVPFAICQIDNTALVATIRAHR